MDRVQVQELLESALVTDAEFILGPEAWDLWDDPLDFFPYEDEEHDESESTDAELAACGGLPRDHSTHAHEDGSECTHDHKTGVNAVRRVITASGVTMVRE
jgi:hypothetical protein